jgi:hypothetical protein
VYGSCDFCPTAVGTRCLVAWRCLKGFRAKPLDGELERAQTDAIMCAGCLSMMLKGNLTQPDLVRPTLVLMVVASLVCVTFDCITSLLVEVECSNCECSLSVP